jgi:hypothetical protein
MNNQSSKRGARKTDFNESKQQGAKLAVSVKVPASEIRFEYLANSNRKFPHSRIRERFFRIAKHHRGNSLRQKHRTAHT